MSNTINQIKALAKEMKEEYLDRVKNGHLSEYFGEKINAMSEQEFVSSFIEIIPDKDHEEQEITDLIKKGYIRKLSSIPDDEHETVMDVRYLYNAIVYHVKESINDSIPLETQASRQICAQAFNN